MLGRLTQRYVKRQGRSWRRGPKASRRWQANMFLKPSHEIRSGRRFPNIVYELAFRAFSEGIGLVSGYSQFLDFCVKARRRIADFLGGNLARGQKAYQRLDRRRDFHLAQRLSSGCAWRYPQNSGMPEPVKAKLCNGRAELQGHHAGVSVRLERLHRSFRPTALASRRAGPSPCPSTFPRIS